jgi:hypothetical protein
MRAEIPIYQTKLPSGSIRYFLKLTIGGRRLDAMLDSGSIGLRLLPGAVPGKAFRRTATECVFTFSNGVELRGNIGRTRVKLDGASGSRSTQVQVVRDICCNSLRPDCPAAQIRKVGRIFGEGFAGMGFRAVLGTGLRASGVENPLARYADTWIIRLPLPGEGRPGSLILGPGSHEKRGFLRFGLREHRLNTKSGEAIGWNDVIPGTLITKGARRVIAGPVALDTGAPCITVVSSRSRSPLPEARQARFIFEHPKQKPLDLNFPMNDRAIPGSRILMRNPEGRQWEGIRAGILPFHSFDVLYDCRRGVIGLKRREDAPASAAA